MPAKKKTRKKAAVKKKSKTTKSSPARKTVKKVVKKKTAPKVAKKSVKKKAGKAAPKQRAKPDQYEELKKLLVGQRRNILKEAREEISKIIDGETKQLIDTALDDGDWSFIDMAEGITLKKLSASKNTLNKIDEALRKINEGTYGLCEDCGDEISKERLKVIPFALCCVECMERRERFEEFEGREMPWLSIEDLL